MASVRTLSRWVLLGAIVLVLAGAVWKAADLIASLASLLVVAAVVYGAYYLLKK